jgi:hypothetical protein
MTAVNSETGDQVTIYTYDKAKGTRSNLATKVRGSSICRMSRTARISPGGIVYHALNPSLWRRVKGDQRAKSILHRWPILMPTDWVERVKTADTESELEALRRSCQRGTPFGSERWQRRTAGALGLSRSLRPRGRPKMETK